MTIPADQNASIHFELDRQARRRIAAFHGAIGDRELLEAYTALLADPTYDPSVDDLVDLRGVTHLGVSGAGVHRLIALYDSRRHSDFATRSAIVAPSDVTFGVARMFQTLRGDESPAEVEVFRSIDESLRWLAREDMALSSVH